MHSFMQRHARWSVVVMARDIPCRGHGGGGCDWCCGLPLVSGVLAGNYAFNGCTALATFSGPLVTSIGPCEQPALRLRIQWQCWRAPRCIDGDVACAVADVVGLEGWLRSVSLERSASGGQRAQLHAASRTSERGHDWRGISQGVAMRMVLWPAWQEKAHSKAALRWPRSQGLP